MEYKLLTTVVSQKLFKKCIKMYYKNLLSINVRKDIINKIYFEKIFNRLGTKSIWLNVIILKLKINK